MQSNAVRFLVIALLLTAASVGAISPRIQTLMPLVLRTNVAGATLPGVPAPCPMPPQPPSA